MFFGRRYLWNIAKNVLTVIITAFIDSIKFTVNNFETKYLKNYEKIGSTYTYKGEVKGTNKEGNIENVKGQENTSKNEPPIKKPPSLQELELKQKPRMIIRPEDILLKDRIRTASRAAKAGFG